MIGDEDSSCEARIRQNVNPDIQKWSDKNHVLRTLGKTLHQSKHFDFGAGNNRLNDTVIEYVLSCFGAALAKNKGDAKGLQKSLEAMVPHPFGSHNLWQLVWFQGRSKKVTNTKIYRAEMILWETG